MARKEIAYQREQVVRWLKTRFPEVDWRSTEELLPPVIWRSRWDQMAQRIGLPYSRKTLQNLDSRGEGPGSFDR